MINHADRDGLASLVYYFYFELGFLVMADGLVEEKVGEYTVGACVSHFESLHIKKIRVGLL